jgi:hypothetical protein
MVVLSLVAAYCVAASNIKDRFAFEQSLSPNQRSEAEKTVRDLAEMPRLSLVEYRGDGSETTLALVGTKEKLGARLHFSLTSGLVYREYKDAYQTRYVSGIILPTDPDYKDKLVEFVRQE